MIKSSKYFFFILLTSFCSQSYSNIDQYFPYKVLPSPSNYGNTGIFEIPNARFMDPANLRFHYSSSYPVEFTALTATPFSWLEATYRYAELENEKYGPVTYSGNQSLKDKGFDLKIRLLEEKDYFPAMAVGLRDIAGTGLFSSEYLVLSKKIGKLDITSGIGWGLLGSSSSIHNPMIGIDKSFKNRNLDQGLGGDFSVNSWFSGEASLLGGLEYDLNKFGLRLKLEYDTSKPFENDRADKKSSSNFNFGLSYYPYNWLTIGAGLERGRQFRLSFSIKGDFYKDTIPKPGPKIVSRLNKEQQERAFQNKEIFYRSLNRSLRQEGIYLQAADYENEKLELSIASNRFFSVTRPVGRSLRIASALSTSNIEEIIVRPMNGDIETARISVNRKSFDLADKVLGSHVELENKSKVTSMSHQPLYQTADFKPTVNFPEFNWNMSPGLKHQIGGPEGFYLGQLYWRTDTNIKFARNLTLYSSFGLNLYDTFEFKNPSFSQIPHVRSDIQDYLKEGKNNIIRMQLEYMFSPRKDVFVRGDMGLLEEMFGGIGGQVLYRPIEKRYALGLSFHKVKQRGFKQRFSFRDYSASTGHLEFYAELPNKIFMQAHVGKYLAGDNGITLDFSRRYDTGFVLGVFATKTNLSDIEFGEGSFDKGFYFSIPTNLFYADFRSGVLSFGLHPLTKDGGAFLTQHNQLYSIFGEVNSHSISRDWRHIID